MSQVTKRSLTVIAGYLTLAVLFSGWIALKCFENGKDVDDGTKLTASSFLQYMGQFSLVLVVHGLPALILGMAGGWWAAMARQTEERERMHPDDRSEATL